MKIVGVGFSESPDSMAVRGLHLMDHYLDFTRLSQPILPICSNNRPDGAVPDSVHHFAEIIQDADVAVFGIPEYTAHYSSAFKNAMDWLVVYDNFNSSLGSNYCMTGKSIFVITFTPTKPGAGDRHFGMTKHLLTKIGANVIDCFVKNDGWDNVVPGNYAFVKDECEKILNAAIGQPVTEDVDTSTKITTWINKYDEWNNKWNNKWKN